MSLSGGLDWTMKGQLEYGGITCRAGAGREVGFTVKLISWGFGDFTPTEE